MNQFTDVGETRRISLRMINPITLEDEWGFLLQTLPTWQPPMIPTLIISPHPDDETLSVGGLIHFLRQNQIDVSVIAVTDGENAYPGRVGLGQIREEEQKVALRELGVPPEKVIRLRMPDSGLDSVETELITALKAHASQGAHIIAPWVGDFHPDHEVCGRAARAVAAETGALLTSYFFWTWHRGTPATLDGLDLVKFPLDEQGLACKNRALLHHRSQLADDSGEPILPEYLLEPMGRTYEVYLPA